MMWDFLKSGRKVKPFGRNIIEAMAYSDLRRYLYELLLLAIKLGLHLYDVEGINKIKISAPEGRTVIPFGKKCVLNYT